MGYKIDNSFFVKGKKAEDAFAKMFLKTTEATKHENINEHWDIKIETKVDIKGIKRVSRVGDLNENIHWVEIRGVSGDGWLYGGKSDYFAFETFDYWIIVEPEKLKNLIKKKVEKIYVDKPENALYKLYKRKNRNDILTMVKTLDLFFISVQVIEKKV
jgi:hypothetical protein